MAARSSSSSISRPADSIAPSSVASVCRGGGRVWCATALEAPVQALSLGQGRQRGVAVLVVLVLAARFVSLGASCLARAAPAVVEPGDVLPARDQTHPPARDEPIGQRRLRRQHGLVGRVTGGRRCSGAVARCRPRLVRRVRLRGVADPDHRLGQRELGVGVERAQEPAHHEIEDPLLVRSQRPGTGNLARRDDRVVVVHLGVVEDAARSRGRRGLAPSTQRLGEGGVRRDLGHARGTAWAARRPDRAAGVASRCAGRSAPCAVRTAPGRPPACASPKSRSGGWRFAAATSDRTAAAAVRATASGRRLSTTGPSGSRGRGVRAGRGRRSASATPRTPKRVTGLSRSDRSVHSAVNVWPRSTVDAKVAAHLPVVARYETRGSPARAAR